MERPVNKHILFNAIKVDSHHTLSDRSHPPPRSETGTWVDKYGTNKNIPLLFGEPTQMCYIRQNARPRKRHKNPYKLEKTHCRQNNECRHYALSFPVAVTSCAVQFYLHYPLISHRTVRRLPIGKDSQELCVLSLSRVDVYRRQSNFLSTKTKMLGDCQIPLIKTHTRTQTRQRGRLDEYIWVQRISQSRWWHNECWGMWTLLCVTV